MAWLLSDHLFIQKSNTKLHGYVEIILLAYQSFKCSLISYNTCSMTTLCSHHCWTLSYYSALVLVKFAQTFAFLKILFEYCFIVCTSIWSKLHELRSSVWSALFRAIVPNDILLGWGEVLLTHFLKAVQICRWDTNGEKGLVLQIYEQQGSWTSRRVNTNVLGHNLTERGLSQSEWSRK